MEIVMKASDKLKAFTKREEGLVLIAYNDNPKNPRNGNLTIGYGHLLPITTKSYSVSITKQDAEKWFEQDIAEAEDVVNKKIKVPLNQNEFDALVDAVFNCGEAVLNGLVDNYLNRGMKAEAIGWLCRWIHEGQQPLEGLSKRRSKDACIFWGLAPNYFEETL